MCIAHIFWVDIFVKRGIKSGERKSRILFEKGNEQLERGTAKEEKCVSPIFFGWAYSFCFSVVCMET